MTKNCLQCNTDFVRKERFSLKWWANAKYCSQLCYHRSKIGKPTPMFGQVSPFKGKTHTKEVREKIRICNIGRKSWNKGKKYSVTWSDERRKSFKERMSGSRNPIWISDRAKLAKRQERNDMAYKEWRKKVWLRDNFTCKIANPDCKGRIEAHHILGWTPYPELRYEVNNGITLCHFHHPRKREDEMNLSPYFQELVGVKVK